MAYETALLHRPRQSVPRTPARLAPLPPPSARAIAEAAELVGPIYDTVLDQGRWNEVLGLCRDFVGGQSASIFAKDETGMAGGIFFYDGRLSEPYPQLYFDTYAHLDPSTGGHLLTPLERPVSTGDIVDLSEFYDTRFYREWVEPQGLVDFISAPIEKIGGWAAMFGVFRHARHGMADDGAKSRLALLVPHIRRAVLIGRVLEERSYRAASLGDACDGLAAGVFLVDAAGSLAHANASGHELLRPGGPLQLRDNRITSANRDAATAIAEMIAAAGRGDTATGTRGVSLPLRDRDGVPYAVHLLPLSSGARRHAGARYAATAALFVHKADIDIPAAPEVIARTFELTLSELRVMLAIVEVGGVPETALALGIAESTVKTHLHQVFAKTGTSRQADLVRIVAGFAGPLTRRA
jgi:DNA-binding CsgD family transcriptional regulator